MTVIANRCRRKIRSFLGAFGGLRVRGGTCFTNAFGKGAIKFGVSQSLVSVAIVTGYVSRTQGWLLRRLFADSKPEKETQTAISGVLVTATKIGVHSIPSAQLKIPGQNKWRSLRLGLKHVVGLKSELPR